MLKNIQKWMSEFDLDLDLTRLPHGDLSAFTSYPRRAARCNSVSPAFLFTMSRLTSGGTGRCETGQDRGKNDGSGGDSCKDGQVSVWTGVKWFIFLSELAWFCLRMDGDFCFKTAGSCLDIYKLNFFFIRKKKFSIFL